MNIYRKQFLQRGVAFGGLGPIIAGGVYVILDHTVEGFSLTGMQVFVAILTTYLLAFLQAGASVFNQIEEWSLPKSLFCHFSVIYAAYTLCYLLNDWIPFQAEVLFIFTAVFAVSYFIVWGIVYLAVRGVSRRLNRKLHP